MKQLIVLACAVTSLSYFASAQAKPFPGPDVHQIYQRLLPQIEKIPAFDHHAHPGFADDPDVDATFAMIHGGYPLEREAIWLAAMKSVYLDSSFGELAQYPSAFKETLKMWLETFPDKITFGTDSFTYNHALGAEV